MMKGVFVFSLFLAGLLSWTCYVEARGSSFRAAGSYYRASSSSSGGSYSPSVRYSRISYRGAYSYYYSKYYYLIIPEPVLGTTYNSGASGNICKNYQANENGTYLGAFKCPLPFEPSDYQFCCGKKELEHCCKLKDSGALYGIIFGTLIFVGLTTLGVLMLAKCYKQSKTRTIHGDINSGASHSLPGSKSPMPPSYQQQTYTSPENYHQIYGNSTFSQQPPSYEVTTSDDAVKSPPITAS